ncbi:hypothetical protein PILCRDRAFT_814537 [Piloderma croceum F 1598]|uniref:Uncharacterized protein n=1 Tax=Piloderma croceum (strain F 1598) TaxID=765440 RepID=A0A0C3CDN3_PILCF|nr:hypothetical protein PILCRDRAFT_814537 [Piloderma croceum F 1598]
MLAIRTEPVLPRFIRAEVEWAFQSTSCSEQHMCAPSLSTPYASATTSYNPYSRASVYKCALACPHVESATNTDPEDVWSGATSALRRVDRARFRQRIANFNGKSTHPAFLGLVMALHSSSQRWMCHSEFFSQNFSPPATPSV